MQTSIFDLVTAKNIVEYFLEKNVNTQPLLGETLFPNVKEIGIHVEWLKGAFNQPIALKLSAYDSKATRRNRPGLEKFIGEMPFFKESMYIDEDMRQKLNTMLQTNNEAVVNSILMKLFDDEINLIKAARISLERMRMEALTTGKLTLASNGQSYTCNYEVPEDQKIDATTKWSDASADIIQDILNVVEKMKAKGVTITRAICNSSVIKCFTLNESIKNSIYVLAGGSIASITPNLAINYINDMTKVQFLAYNNVYVDDDGSAVKYVADNTVIFMPDGELGQTHLGTTPEESDLMTLGTAKVSLVDNGIAVATYGTEDPVNVETKVSMVALPSFERANEIVIFDTEKQ